ncbi:MAG: diguanylate cyclase [Herminiimonas sp.]|nr:diguanylate cyclase [Herminiimonas sp.]
MSRLVFKPLRAFQKSVAYSALIVAAIAASAWVVYGWAWQRGLDELHLVAARRMQTASASLLVPTDKYSYLPALLASHPTVLELLRYPDRRDVVQRANLFLDKIQKDSHAGVVYVIDQEGLTLASSNWNSKDSFVGQSYSYRPYFQEALRTGQGHFYGMGVVSLQPGYYLARSAMDDGRVLGVTVVKVDIGRTDESWRGGPGEITVTDENGVVFLSSRPDWKYRPLQALDDATLAEVKRTRQYEDVLKPPMRIRTGKTLAEGERLVTLLPLADEAKPATGAEWFLRSGALTGSPWTVNVFLPMDQVERQAQRDAILCAGVISFLMLSLMYVVQLRNRTAEREASRKALNLAHRSLELKHQDLQKLTEDLRLVSITDALTGAYNRRYFQDASAKMVSSARRHGQPLSVVVIDADRFKDINDRHGHPAGDKALQELTAACREGLREEDLFARFGGEEFILLLPNTDAEAARVTAERVRRNVMAREVELDGTTITMTVSSGVSQWRPDEPSIDEAIRRADRAVYAAKDLGRNRVVVE